MLQVKQLLITLDVARPDTIEEFHPLRCGLELVQLVVHKV